MQKKVGNNGALQGNLCSGLALCAAILLIVSTQVSLAAEPAPAVPCPNGGDWVQTFSADFTAPNATLNGWTIERGTGSQYGLDGWGNHEAESYTDDAANLNISGGALNLVARVEDQGKKVTSARINTKNLFSQAYGLFEFKAKLPAGPDLWPAIWLMPVKGVYGGWPTSGEIDIVESGARDATPNKHVQGTCHSGAKWDADVIQTGFYNTSNDPDFDTTNWNTYDLLWTPGADENTPGTLKWYVNGHLYQTRSGGWHRPSPTASATAPYDRPFYIVMNLAVGGPRTPYTGGQTPVDGTYTMQISNVRVYAYPKTE